MQKMRTFNPVLPLERSKRKQFQRNEMPALPITEISGYFKEKAILQVKTHDGVFNSRYEKQGRNCLIMG